MSRPAKYGPRESRAESYARAARAARMRGSGATWDQIARHEGYPNLGAARRAVIRHRERETGTVASLANRRYDADEAYRVLQTVAFAEMADARQQGDRQGVVACIGKAADIVAKRVQLGGLAVPVAQQVDVSVTHDLAALMEQAEAALLRLADGLSSGRAALPAQAVLDAEVVTEVGR